MSFYSTRLVFYVALLGVLCGSGCDSPASPNPEVHTLKAAVDAIWFDASVGTDADYQKLFRNNVRAQAVAPVDLREVITSWNGYKSLRRWPHGLRFTCSEKRVGVSWSGELANELDGVEALKRFDKSMEEKGYQVHSKSKAIEELGQRLGLAAKDLDNWTSSQQYHGYIRKVGDTEIGALAEASEYTGGRNLQSGIEFHWFVVRPYPDQQPTLGETLAALPAWFRVPYLDASFYKALANETITACNSGSGTSIQFQESVYDKLVKALEGSGFEYRDEKEPHRDGGTQKTWYRYTDVMFAHITTYPDSEQTRFYCQAPQHEGEPKKDKPLPLHPSLRLPPSKRPVLELEQLAFADPKLKQRVQLFHDFAEGIAEDEWFVQHYKDVRYSPNPSYLATWQTIEVHSSYYLKLVRPYRSITIRLDGPSVKEGDEQITRMEVSGRWVPDQGWAATVNCHVLPMGVHYWARVGLVQESDGRFSFDSSPSRPVIPLSAISVSATVRENSKRQFSYSVQLPVPQPAERRNHFLTLFDSPEKLRDSVTGEIAELRRIARDEIPRSERMEVIDSSNARSDNPPRSEPVFRNPPSEETRQKLLDQVLAELNSMETSVRENYAQIHAAISKALPLGEFPKALANLESED